MTGSGRISATCCVALLAAGCVLHVSIEAGFDSGKLVFRSDQQGEDHWCLDEFRVVDRATGKVMWSIVEDRTKPQRQFCEDDFPLTYGATPPWMKVETPAQQLVSGHVYDIAGTSGNILGGAFRYEVRRVVTNVDERGN